MNGPVWSQSALPDMAWTAHQQHHFRHHFLDHHTAPVLAPHGGRAPSAFGYDLPALHSQPHQQPVEHFNSYRGHSLAPPFAPVMSSRHYQPVPMMPLHPSFPSGFYSVPPQQHHQPAMPPLPLPHHIEPQETYQRGYSPMQDVAFGGSFGNAPQEIGVDTRRGRWFGNGEGKDARVLHHSGSFHEQPRPPVRRNDSSSAVRAGGHVTPIANVSPAATASEQPRATLLPTAAGEPLLYDLISNTSVVPPPPGIELSAVPLADLATEMVWEACALGVEAISSPPEDLAYKPLSFLITASGSSSPSRSRGCNTPELTFGAIGEERRARKLSVGPGNGANSGWSSDFSSPSSSTPGTPDGVGALEAAVARRQKLAGLGFGYVGDGGKPFASLLSSEDDERRALESPIGAIRAHSRKTSNKVANFASSNALSTFSPDPSPAFRQFVKQVLTATLLTPEDLILALYYVARIPSRLFVQMPSGEQVNNASARASAIKSAPFKILLGALMLANKTLQDHNYRCDTWSTVSAIPLKDVNAIEVYVFSALGFDVAVRDDTWSPWLTVVRERANACRGDTGDHFEVDQALLRIMRAARDHVLPPLPPRHVTDAPALGSVDALFGVDFDASGPLESPIRPRPSSLPREKAALPPLTRTYSQAVASELYIR